MLPKTLDLVAAQRDTHTPAPCDTPNLEPDPVGRAQ
jgi:hypothetical protein